MVFAIICTQIMCMNIPVHFYDHLESQSGVYLSIDAEGESSQGHSQDFPKSENESLEDNESFSLKIFTCLSKDLVIFNSQNLNFLSYNTENKVQFHPELSTPPPEYFFFIIG